MKDDSDPGWSRHTLAIIAQAESLGYKLRPNNEPPRYGWDLLARDEVVKEHERLDVIETFLFGLEER